MSGQSTCGDQPRDLHYVGHGFVQKRPLWWHPMGHNLVHYTRPATRKIAEPEAAPVCFDSQHMPPTMQVFSPGTWEHECPSCGLVTVFQVSR